MPRWQDSATSSPASPPGIPGETVARYTAKAPAPTPRPAGEKRPCIRCKLFDVRATGKQLACRLNKSLGGYSSCRRKLLYDAAARELNIEIPSNGLSCPAISVLWRKDTPT